ncbi:MAG: AAA family ATPase [Anaerolineae bacterium]|nr:AAA family ATPase [Anaerolineae bacterium]
MDENIIITGFMGTGKSTVGPVVADMLNMRFVDMDPIIEARAGMTIPEIFEKRGEKIFRVMEGVVCHDLAKERGLVIATGGGALLDPGNRNVLGQTGLIICLTASLETILQRLADATDRPLIATPDQARQIKALIDWRKPYYDALPAHVDTTGLSVPEAANRVVETWRRWKQQQKQARVEEQQLERDFKSRTRE